MKTEKIVVSGVPGACQEFSSTKMTLAELVFKNISTKSISGIK